MPHSHTTFAAVKCLIILLSSFWALTDMVGQNRVFTDRQLEQLNIALSNSEDVGYEIKGSPYLYEGWQQMLVRLGWSDIILDSVKYNIDRQALEVLLNNEFKIINSQYLDYFRVLSVPEDSNYIFKAKHFFFHNGKKLPGIVKSYEVGEHQVLETNEIFVRRPDDSSKPYSAEELTANEIKIRSKLFLEYDGLLTPIRRAKDLQKYFGEDQKEVKAFMKSNDLDADQFGDVVKVVEYAYELKGL